MIEIPEQLNFTNSQKISLFIIGNYACASD
jgi:hypothetical protein